MRKAQFEALSSSAEMLAFLRLGGMFAIDAGLWCLENEFCYEIGRNVEEEKDPTIESGMSRYLKLMRGASRALFLGDGSRQTRRRWQPRAEVTR